VHTPPAHEHAEQAEARLGLPRLAAGLADVGGGHAHPGVARGLEQHLLQESAIRLMLPATLLEHPAGGGRPVRQLVAHALELSEGEEARSAGGGAGARRHRPVAKERGELRLEPCDLIAQRGAGGPLVRRRDERLSYGCGEHGHPPIGALGFVPQKT
jgi:hypothetical protein